MVRKRALHGPSKLSEGFTTVDAEGEPIWVPKKVDFARAIGSDLDGPGSSASGLKGYHSSKVADPVTRAMESSNSPRSSGQGFMMAGAPAAAPEPSKPASAVFPAQISLPAFTPLKAPVPAFTPLKAPVPTQAVLPPMGINALPLSGVRYCGLEPPVAALRLTSPSPPPPAPIPAPIPAPVLAPPQQGPIAPSMAIGGFPRNGWVDPAPGSLVPIARDANVPWSFEGKVQRFLGLAQSCPGDWDLLVGSFFMWSGNSPMEVLWGALGGHVWERDLAKLDRLENDGNQVSVWRMSAEMQSSKLVTGLNVFPDALDAFKEGMKRFARSAPYSRLAHILEKACWTRDVWGSPDWRVMANVKEMPEGPEREAMLAKAKKEMPRFFERCYNDRLCGGYRITKPRQEPYSADLPPDEAWFVSYGKEGRRERYDSSYDEIYAKELADAYEKEKRMMAFAGGKPTQIHAVPYEERAFDSHGRKLPWAHEWPEGHPNARGHRRQPEEKGPFGKSSIRKSSSRATRTATPAKKENPALDGFEQAWKHDQKKAAEAQQQASATKPQGDGTSVLRQTSKIKEPTQVMLYGFSVSTQWAAISWYETVSGGMVCEDYERQPPMELRRIPNAFSSPVSVHSRALTPAEKSLASKYDGGDHWIKVTFDSAEAAERAIYHSPHFIQGHWIYAQEYRGVGPEVDEPILIRKDDRDSASLGVSGRPSQTIGPSFGQKSHIDSRATATLPRSFTTNAEPQTSDHEMIDVASHSSSTASSATAIGPTHPDLRNRRLSQTEANRSSLTSQPNGQAASRSQGFTHFPDIPRTVLRPASEAFLPHPTWSESLLQRLINAGWIPNDFIGAGAPRMENGDFDYAHASYYWRFFHWLDSILGTDLCGLKD